MATFEQAQRLATSWVEVASEGQGALSGRVLAKPYGWVFFWTSRASLKAGVNDLIGNSPVFVDRVNLELR